MALTACNDTRAVWGTVPEGGPFHVPPPPLSNPMCAVPAATTVQTGPSPGSPAGGAHPDPCQHHAGALALHQAQQAAGQSREGIHQLQPLLPSGQSIPLLGMPRGCPCPAVAARLTWGLAGRRAPFPPVKVGKSMLWCASVSLPCTSWGWGSPCSCLALFMLGRRSP